MADVRERRHRQTSDEIVAAALDLFRDEGYADVTIERIARAAGVSRRTVYRRFPTKDLVVLAVPHGWLEAWDDAVAAAPPDTPARRVAETAARAVAERIDADAGRAGCRGRAGPAYLGRRRQLVGQRGHRRDHP